jgi:hypothetical protein
LEANQLQALMSMLLLAVGQHPFLLPVAAVSQHLSCFHGNELHYYLRQAVQERSQGSIRLDEPFVPLADPVPVFVDIERISTLDTDTGTHATHLRTTPAGDGNEHVAHQLQSCKCLARDCVQALPLCLSCVAWNAKALGDEAQNVLAHVILYCHVALLAWVVS